jgi:hypothetical protein
MWEQITYFMEQDKVDSFPTFADSWPAKLHPWVTTERESDSTPSSPSCAQIIFQETLTRHIVLTTPCSRVLKAEPPLPFGRTFP